MKSDFSKFYSLKLGVSDVLVVAVWLFGEPGLELYVFVFFREQGIVGGNFSTPNHMTSHVFSHRFHGELCIFIWFYTIFMLIY